MSNPEQLRDKLRDALAVFGELAYTLEALTARHAQAREAVNAAYAELQKANGGTQVAVPAATLPADVLE